MFVRSLWYVACYSSDVEPGKCLARRFLNEPVVLFRTRSGVLSALQDRCSHRAMPLSTGHVDGEVLRCPYHGLEFGPGGACVRIPGQDRISASARVRPYPVAERDGLVWIWMGDADRADSNLIIENPEFRDSTWAWRTCYTHLKANWQLLVDNLLDLTHVAYIHANTIGGDPQTHFNADVTVEFDGHRLSLLRKMPNSMPPSTYVAVAGFTGKVDRWQQVGYWPERGNVLRVDAGACDADTGADEGRRGKSFVSVVVHGVTPETETSTHYIWTVGTTAPREPGVHEVLFDQIHETIREDERALEAQQRRIDDLPNMRFMTIASDAAVVRGRKLLDELKQAERAAGPWRGSDAVDPPTH